MSFETILSPGELQAKPIYPNNFNQKQKTA